MRPPCALTVIAVLFFAVPASGADKAERGLSLLAGASVFFAGFSVGGSLLATSRASATQSNAGWLTIEAAFAVAPFTSHALAGEWLRAFAFSAVPATTAGSTATLFAVDPKAIDHGSLPEQRVLWALFGIGLFSSAVGVVDSVFAHGRAGAVAVAPVLGPGQVGLKIGGAL